jgi:hypothetical protein
VLTVDALDATTVSHVFAALHQYWRLLAKDQNECATAFVALRAGTEEVVSPSTPWSEAPTLKLLKVPADTPTVQVVAGEATKVFPPHTEARAALAHFGAVARGWECPSELLTLHDIASQAPACVPLRRSLTAMTQRATIATTDGQTHSWNFSPEDGARLAARNALAQLEGPQWRGYAPLATFVDDQGRQAPLQDGGRYALALRFVVRFVSAGPKKRSCNASFVWTVSDGLPCVGDLRKFFLVPSATLVVDAAYGVVLHPSDPLPATQSLLVIGASCMPCAPPSVCRVVFPGGQVAQEFHSFTPLRKVWRWASKFHGALTEHRVMCWGNVALLPGQGLDNARLISLYFPFSDREAPAAVPEECPRTGIPDLDDAEEAAEAIQSTGLPDVEDAEECAAAETGLPRTDHTGLPDPDRSTTTANEAPIDEAPLMDSLDDGVWVLPVQLVHSDRIEECLTELTASPVRYLLPQPASALRTPFLSIVKGQEGSIARNILSRAVAIAYGFTEDLSMACRLRLVRAENDALRLDGECKVEPDNTTVTFPSLRCTVTVRFVRDHTPRSVIVATAQLAAGLPPDAVGDIPIDAASRRD